MRTMLAALAAALASAAPAGAQVPACPPFTQGKIPTAGQWQACFDSKQPSLGYSPVNKAGDTMSGTLVLAPSTTSAPGLNLQPGITPTAPLNGAMWATAFGSYFFMNGVTYNVIQSLNIVPLNSGAVLTGGATRYFASSGNANELIAAAVASQGGTFTHFYAKVETAPTSGQSVAFTLRVNGADTALTCTIADAATTCSDVNLAHAVAVLEGQDWSVKAVSSASAASTAARGGVLLVNP